jgi:hypothetical protein
VITWVRLAAARVPVEASLPMIANPVLFLAGLRLVVVMAMAGREWAPGRRPDGPGRKAAAGGERRLRERRGPGRTREGRDQRRLHDRMTADMVEDFHDLVAGQLPRARGRALGGVGIDRTG